MISTPPPFLAFAPSRNVLGKSCIENENPALSPKRCFSQQEEDHPPQLDLKRRHVHPDSQLSRRAPLDPLSVSDLENRRLRRSQSTGSLSHLSLVMPTSLPDLRVFHPEQPLSAGPRGMPLSDTSGDPVCSWPPPSSLASTVGSLYSGSGPVGHQATQSRSLHSFDDNQASRATFFGPPSHFQTENMTTMVKPVRSTASKSGDMLQPIRLRTFPMPSVRRPPEELWQSGFGPTEVVHEPVGATDLLSFPTPPGLPLPSELRRRNSGSDSLLRASVSSSLALGSQPLKASELTKVVPPIGAERSRVISITSFKSSIQNSPSATTVNLSQSPPSSPRLQAKWKKNLSLSNATSLEKAQAATGYTSVSSEDLSRLLRHAVWNKHAPKIVSPLNPLRTATSALDLSADPTFQRRMPSQSNQLSPRYSKCPPRRTRTLCDAHQSLDWDTTCMHCQECKRDTVGKRLLALRYRQRQSHHVQRNRPHLTLSFRGGVTGSVVDDDRMALANHIREAFAYDVDDEEKSLWEEVAAVTGAAPLPFSRVGAPCAAAHRRVVDSESDDAVHDDYLEIPDEGMRANKSATLFRDVSVY